MSKKNMMKLEALTEMLDKIDMTHRHDCEVCGQKADPDDEYDYESFDEEES